MVVVAGIDVSRATLDVSVSEGPVIHFENSTTGIRRLLRHVERAGVTKAVCESTGGYERLVVGKLRETAINVQVAHPVRVRAFARACGYEAKTDPLDAQVLSRYGVVFSESDTTQPEVDPDREELRQLLSRRRQLVEQRVRERNRLDKGVSASVGKSTRRHVRWLDREMERLEEEYKQPQSLMSRPESVRVPVNTRPCHSVEDGQQLPCTRSESHLLRLSGFEQPLVEVA